MQQYLEHSFGVRVLILLFSKNNGKNVVLKPNHKNNQNPRNKKKKKAFNLLFVIPKPQMKSSSSISSLLSINHMISINKNVFTSM